MSYSRKALQLKGDSPHNPSTSIGIHYHDCSVEEQPQCLVGSAVVEGLGYPGPGLVVPWLPSPRPKSQGWP